MTSIKKELNKFKKAIKKLSNDDLIKEHKHALKLYANGKQEVQLLLNLIELEFKKRNITGYSY